MPVYPNDGREGRGPRLSRAERRRLVREAARIDREALKQQIGAGVLELGVHLSLAEVAEMLDEDADRLAGAPKGKHRADRVGRRHGYAEGSIVVGGKKVGIRRPRVRSLAGEELELPTYAWAQDPTVLEESSLRMMVLGVATRGYREAVESPLCPIPEGVVVRGVSKSAVSRRFVARAEEALRGWLARSLAGQRYLVLYLDGVEEGGHHALVAMGVTETGRKEIVGIGEGSSENATVARELLEDLLARGLDVNRGLLVVLDGSKALAAAVEEVLGDRVLVQRCQVHKRRNVLEKLPTSRQAQVRREMEEAWRAEDASQAQAKLEALADRLEQEGYRQAAASLREGLPQTLTCLKLGVDPALSPSLTNTNPLESVFAKHAACARRVSRWRNGRQVVRWVGIALMRAERSLAPLGAQEALGDLARRLEEHARRAAAGEVPAVA